MSAALLLIDPKYPHNVGGALRALATLGDGHTLRWTGERVADSSRDVAATSGRSMPRNARKWRLPREERMKVWQFIDWQRTTEERPLDGFAVQGFTPVAVEVLPNSESLLDFEHPDDAVYVFGPEDGSLPKGIRAQCHRFVSIPSRTCLNLAAAVNVVLYDRLAKSGATAPVEIESAAIGAPR